MAPPLGVTPFEFCRDLRHQKTRVPIGNRATILRLTATGTVEHRLVTTRQTDTTRHIPH